MNSEFVKFFLNFVIRCNYNAEISLKFKLTSLLLLRKTKPVITKMANETIPKTLSNIFFEAIANLYKFISYVKGKLKQN